MQTTTQLLDFGVDIETAVHLPRFGGSSMNDFTALMIEADMKVYDYLSHICVVEEAGGRITDWQGQPLGLASDHRVLAAGDPACHERALALLQQG